MGDWGRSPPGCFPYRFVSGARPSKTSAICLDPSQSSLRHMPSLSGTETGTEAQGSISTVLQMALKQVLPSEDHLPPSSETRELSDLFSTWSPVVAGQWQDFTPTATSHYCPLWPFSGRPLLPGRHPGGRRAKQALPSSAQEEAVGSLAYSCLAK